MKLFTVMIVILFSFSLFAHEGHGEMPTESSKYGGVMGNVVSESKMMKKEKNNPPLMKAEIVRSDDGMVRLYLYDLKMNLLTDKDFLKDAQGILENNKAKTKDQFSLTLHGNHYMGKIPKQKRRPFNIYISFSKGPEKLFVGFDNLD